MSSSELSSISSESEAQSSSNSSSSSSQSSKSQKGRKGSSKLPVEWLRNRRKRLSDMKNLSIPSIKRSSSIYQGLPLEKKISFNLDNQEIQRGDQKKNDQQRVNRGRKKSKFSQSDIFQPDLRQSQSLKLMRQKSDQFQMRRKVSDPISSSQPQSILKKWGSKNSSISVIEGSHVELLNSKEISTQIINSKDTSPRNMNESNSVVAQFGMNKQDKNMFQSNIAQSEQNLQHNTPKMNLSSPNNKNMMIPTQNNANYYVQSLAGLNQNVRIISNLNEGSSQSNSNQSLNNTGGGQTPSNNNTQGNSTQLNNSIHTPPSLINRSNLNFNTLATNGGGFSEYVLHSQNTNSQANTNSNTHSATSIAHHIQNIHRSPSQQQFLSKKKDYHEVLRELVETQEKLRMQEDKNEQLEKHFKQADDNHRVLMQQKQVLQIKNSAKHALIKEVKQRLNGIQKKAKLVAIHVPFNQRIISKFDKLFKAVYYNTIFLKKTLLENRIFDCSNSINFVRNSVYLYNLLFVNAIFSLIIIAKIILNSDLTILSWIDSSFYSSFNSNMTLLFTLSQKNLLFSFI